MASRGIPYSTVLRKLYCQESEHGAGGGASQAKEGLGSSSSPEIHTDLKGSTDLGSWAACSGACSGNPLSLFTQGNNLAESPQVKSYGDSTPV